MSKNNIFNSIQLTKPKKNVFDLSHDVKMSMVMGRLTPSLCMECVPGDKVTLGCDSLVRFAPLIAPLMHRIDVYMHYFFVPNRLLWDNWEKFITNSEPVPPAFPTVALDPTHFTLLHDYLGLPKPAAGAPNSERVSALPFAAYQKIFNEYYRDQNMTPTPNNDKCVNGNNDPQNLTDIRQRAWEHDYFTAALPQAQKGTAVDLPLGNITLDPDWGLNPLYPVMKDTTMDSSGAGNVVGTGSNLQMGGVAVAYDPEGSLEVSPTTINDLRRAYKLQEWLEKAMRGGSRYVENILNHFGVRSSDKRLQRPEYITGSKTPVVISEVLNTSDTTNAPQGNMSGHAIGVTSGSYGSYFCEEHGYIMGIMSVLPKTAYQDGIPKHFLKNDMTEFFWPSFAHIGEQPVLYKELMAFNTAGANPEDTFGYVPRYAEYKFQNNRVAGLFRTTLDHWHLGRIFDPTDPPALNSVFVSSIPSERIFAVQDGSDYLYVQVLHKIKAVRPMPKFGTPSF